MRNLIKKPVNTIFLGSGWESLETLKTLHHDKRFNIIAVVTPPDSLVGRKHIQTPSVIKKYALENSIISLHTNKERENYLKIIKKYKPELVVCKSFGEIIPKEFIEYPKYGSINIHFSLLPKYRGAVPIQKAILEGEKKTGISIILMSERLDEGDILYTYEENILDSDTNLTLRKRLVKKSAHTIGDVLEQWILGNIKPKKQNNEDASYCWQKDISKEKALIDWKHMTPEYIERMIRAYLPWPIAWTVIQNNAGNIAKKKIKIFKAKLIGYKSEKDSGSMFIKDNMLLFATRDPLICLRVFEIQMEGKKKMREKEFINGLKI